MLYEVYLKNDRVIRVEADDVADIVEEHTANFLIRKPVREEKGVFKHEIVASFNTDNLYGYKKLSDDSNDPVFKPLTKDKTVTVLSLTNGRVIAVLADEEAVKNYKADLYMNGIQSFEVEECSCLVGAKLPISEVLKRKRK